MPKNADFLQKKADISKIQRALVLKGMISETTFVWVVTYQISSCQRNSNEFQTGGGSFTPSPSKQTSKKPTQIRIIVYYYFIISTAFTSLNEPHPQCVHDQLQHIHIQCLDYRHIQAIQIFNSFQSTRSLHSMCILRNTSSHVLYMQVLVSISSFYIHVKGESVFAS